MKKKYHNDWEDFENEEFLNDFEESFDEPEIFDDFEPEIPDIDLLNDVFEGDIDLYQNYLDG